MVTPPMMMMPTVTGMPAKPCSSTATAAHLDAMSTTLSTEPAQAITCCDGTL